jgi:hypothetical protein
VTPIDSHTRFPDQFSIQGNCVQIDGFFTIFFQIFLISPLFYGPGKCEKMMNFPLIFSSRKSPFFTSSCPWKTLWKSCIFSPFLPPDYPYILKIFHPLKIYYKLPVFQLFTPLDNWQIIAVSWHDFLTVFWPQSLQFSEDFLWSEKPHSIGNFL